MTRETKPTLTPNTTLSSRENDTFSRFLLVSSRDPVFALSCVKRFVTNAELIQEARTLQLESEQLPERQVVEAVANLINHEVIFSLDVDPQTKESAQQHLVGAEVSSMRKVKAYLGELAAHNLYLESQTLRGIAVRTADQDYAEVSTDSDLYVAVFDPRPNLDAA